MNAIKEMRVEKGLSTAELAEMIHVHARSIRDWERGKYSPSEENQKKLASVFRCSTEALGLPIRILKRSIEDRNQLVLDFMNIIGVTIYRNGALVRASLSEKDDLIQDLALSLIMAAGTFDSTRGTFLSHAMRYLQFELQAKARLYGARGIKDVPRGVFLDFISLNSLRV